MNTRFVQKSIGYCTLYTLANLFDESAIMNFANDEKFKGCGDDEVNEVLELYNMKIGNVAYVNQSYGTLPSDFIWDVLNSEKINDDFHYIPYFMTVRRLPEVKDLWHSVGLVYTRHGLFYSDPYFDKWYKIENSDMLRSMYIDCHVIARPYRKEDDKFAIIHGRQAWIEELIGYELIS